jgi:hypothetical protein
MEKPSERIGLLVLPFLGKFVLAVNLAGVLGRGQNLLELILDLLNRHASYRYKKVDGERVGLEPDTDAPEKMKTVRHIYDAYANRDLSLTAIVAELDSLSFPSPQGHSKWAKHTVHGILTNSTYAGCYVWGKVTQGKYYRCDGGAIQHGENLT